MITRIRPLSRSVVRWTKARRSKSTWAPPQLRQTLLHLPQRRRPALPRSRLRSPRHNPARVRKKSSSSRRSRRRRVSSRHGSVSTCMSHRCVQAPQATRRQGKAAELDVSQLSTVHGILFAHTCERFEVAVPFFLRRRHDGQLRLASTRRNAAANRVVIT